MLINVNIKNPHDSDVAFAGRLFVKGFDRDEKLSLLDYKNYKDFNGLEVNFKGYEYNSFDKLENLTLKELRIFAEIKGIENYWTKGKKTLVEEITELENEDNNTELELEEGG